MNWQSLQFVQNLERCGNRYELENRWFKKEAWGDRHSYTLAAWRLYRCANRNALGMLILGAAKIRKDPALLANFGVTSGNGINDEEELRLVRELEQRREASRAVPALRDTPKVLGLGSILNDKEWTPLLNDSFILGGVHGRHEFHLAEDNMNTYSRFLETRAKFGGGLPTNATEKWLGFLRAHPELLWDMSLGNPRILARELTGLMAFGYRPKFFDQQLSFYCDQADRAVAANFSRYLNAVDEAGIGRRDASAVLGKISNFLFGRGDVFRGVTLS